MRELIIDNFSSMTSLNSYFFLLNNIVAIIISLFIFLVYRITYNGASYSSRFNISLGMITIITAIVMNVISNNIALSLGMVGALSIIRFRTAVKDIRDATFIFWSIAVGIACGVAQYIPAIIGSVSVAIFLLIMRQIKKEGIYLIIIRSSFKSQSNVEAMIEQYFSNKAILKVKNSTKDYGDLIYEVNYRDIIKSLEKHNESIVEKLIKLDGVISVEQVEQNDHITR